MKESSVILWFIKIDLKQIYCSSSRTHKISEWFSIISVICFEVSVGAAQKQV